MLCRWAAGRAFQGPAPFLDSSGSAVVQHLPPSTSPEHSSDTRVWKLLGLYVAPGQGLKEFVAQH